MAPGDGGRGGFTLIEMAASLLVFAIAATVLINHLTINYQATRMERDRVFAYSKAQSILSEIQSFVDQGTIGSAADLDALDNGVVPVPQLTISTDSGGNLLAADHVVSGNSTIAGDWMWKRQISVQPLPGIDNRNVRYVTVRIFKRDMAGVDHPIADLSAVVNAAGEGFPTTQVYDVFLLAIENVPGWWVYMDSIRPFVESTITDLETRNPGMEIRTHWITKLGYGRNRMYAPYVNDANDSHQPFPEVYLYPGRMPVGQSSAYYYVPANMKARVWVDGVERNGYDPLTNPEPYALADWFNHCMRYPEAKAFHERRVALIQQRLAEREADLLAGVDPDTNGHPLLDDMSTEPTWRLMLEDMCSEPQKYGNALLINLHGELLPMPPLRNHSDPSRVPDYAPGTRVVTHPEQLRTHRDPAGVATEDVVLRTHVFKEDPVTFGTPLNWETPDLDLDSKWICLRIKGIDFTVNPEAATGLNKAIGIEWMPGGRVVDGANNPVEEKFSGWQPLLASSPGVADPEMYWAVGRNSLSGDFYTYVFISNPRFGCGADVDGRGLAATERARLHGLEYQPGFPGVGGAGYDLDALGNGPKNTARFRITIDRSVIDGTGDALFRDSMAGPLYQHTGDLVLEIGTYLWAGSYDPGRMWPTAFQPDNMSTTYTWWCDSPDDVPFTERSQFLGDPRHNPYRDLLAGDPDFPDRYNWFFDSLRNDSEDSAADHPGINGSLLSNRWDGRARHDVGRFMEVVRTALSRSNAVYTSLTGWSYYYLGIGNEIGYDAANGYPNSIPVERSAWGGSGTGYQNNITGSRCFVRTSGTLDWYGRPWLGELYPDSAWSLWSQDMDPGPDQAFRGNLPAGTGAGEFHRGNDYSTYQASGKTAYGTRVYSSNHRLANQGCASFMNANSASATFHHFSSSGTGNLVGPGIELGNNYNFPMPDTAQISRPWDVNRNSGTPPEFGEPAYSGNRFRADLLETYYTHSSGEIGSGLVGLTPPDNSGTAYIVVNGIDKTTETGTSFISKFALLSLIHTYFEAGNTSYTHRIVQPPRVEIVFPTDVSELNGPTELDVRFTVDWSRWDGEPYTASGVQPVEPESDLEYAVMYSRDGGRNWLYLDNTPAEPMQRPSDPSKLISDVSAGDEVITWQVPADTGNPDTSFPRGTYQLRVECYRTGQELHYSWHQTRFFIQR